MTRRPAHITAVAPDFGTLRRVRAVLTANAPLAGAEEVPPTKLCRLCAIDMSFTVRIPSKRSATYVTGVVLPRLTAEFAEWHAAEIAVSALGA